MFPSSIYTISYFCMVSAFPPGFLKSLQSCEGFSEDSFVHAHELQNRVTSIRLNPFKKVDLDFETNRAVPWCSDAYYLDQRPSFTHDPLFHAGAYYVQEAGSMFLEFALKTVCDFSTELKVLDLCGAPGGKSTLINSLLSGGSLLVSNEVHKKRAEILVQNLGRWGQINNLVTCNDAKNFAELKSFFDVMVVDAPCSGSGLFRKQPEAVEEWSPELVSMCSARQKNILEDAYPSLAENGILIYSTCSYSKEENEDVVRWLVDTLSFEYIPLQVPGEWNIVETPFGYRFYPDKTASEGFFLAVLRKKENSGRPPKMLKTGSFAPKKTDFDAIQGFFSDFDAELFDLSGNYHYLNSNALDFLNTFRKHFYFRKAGLYVGEMKGDDLVPGQDLAWFMGVKESFKKNLDREKCIAYLRKENIDISGFQRGFALICYKNLGLGWAKILNNRANNYLPSELRILT